MPGERPLGQLGVDVRLQGEVTQTRQGIADPIAIVVDTAQDEWAAQLPVQQLLARQPMRRDDPLVENRRGRGRRGHPGQADA